MNPAKLICIICIFAILLSCNPGNENGCTNTCGCGGPIEASYDIQSIVIMNHSFVKLSNNAHSPTDTYPLDPLAKVNALNYLIELKAVTEPPYYTASKNFTIMDFFFGKPAMACSPLPPYTDELISQLTITSDSDFSTLYPAGSSLNKLFAVQYTSAYQDYDYTSGQNVDEFVDFNPHGALKIQIVLTEPPTVAKEHVFKIQYMHDSGEYFEVYTAQVVFE